MGSRIESHFSLEVQAGFEPADNGVADRGLTAWLLHQIFDCLNIIAELFLFVNSFLVKICIFGKTIMISYCKIVFFVIK